MTAADPRTGLHLTLIGAPMSPHLQCVAILLVERGTPHEQVQIDLGQKLPWFTKLAPLGRVPLMRSEAAVRRSASCSKASRSSSFWRTSIRTCRSIRPTRWVVRSIALGFFSPRT